MPRFAGATVPAGAPAIGFALRDQNGRLVSLRGQSGSFVFVTFLYTHCVDVCPLIAENLNATLREIGHQRSSVRVLAVSVDPEHDTRRAVRAYVREHRLLPQFHYLIGTRAQLKPVWQGYNVLVERRNPDLVAHTASIFLLDRHGRPVLVYPSSVRAAAVLHDLRRLLVQGA